MFDPNKPIEYHYNNTEWCEAVLLDSAFNSGYLIKYRMSPTVIWFHGYVPGCDADKKIRNVPEKHIYRVVVTRNGVRNGICTSKVDVPYSIGETYCGGTVIGYHEGEFTV